MSTILNNFFVSTDLNFFAKQAVNAADKLTECTFHILDSATTSLGRLLPNLRPTSLGDVILQAKKTGSAWFTTPQGNYLIEITKDKAGRYTFHAVGESLKPVIFHEGKKRMSGAVWEVKVSEYLQKIVKNAESVSYGDVATRWRGDKFVALKEQFCADGLLRKRGDEVLLKLPEEPPMIFKGPQASLKAEMVLKHFYQDRKTPIEEQQSERWDTLNRLFLGYLYFSGYALAPWVNDNVMLPHQRAQREEKQAQRIAADSFLDDSELREMVQNPNLRQSVIDMAEAQADGGDTRLLSQLEEITFQKDGYSQTYEYDGKSYEDGLIFSSNKEVHSRKVCPKAGFCEEFITEKSDENLIYTQKQHRADKIDVQKATFQKDGDEWTLVKEEKYEENRILRLSDRSFASTILAQSQQITVNTATVCLATVLSGQTPQMAVIASLFSLVSHARAIAVSPPVAEARQVKEIKSGSAASAMRRTAPITLLNSFPPLFVDIGAQLSYTINLQSDYQLSNPNLNMGLSIQQANGMPVPSWLSMNMGPTSQINSGSFGGTNFCVSAGYIYVIVGYTFNVIDTNTLATVGQWTSPYGISNVYVQGNYAFLVAPPTPTNATCQILAIDISSSSTPVFVSELNLNSTAETLVGSFLLNDYIYIMMRNTTDYKSSNLITINISDPKQLIQTSSLILPQALGSVYADKNYLFSLSTSNSPVAVMNITTPSTPSLLTTTPFGKVYTAIAVKDNYLFIGYNDLLIYDISNITNPALVKTLFLGNKDYAFAVVNFNSLTINGNYLYASCLHYGVTVIDITDVPHAQIVESFGGGLNVDVYQSFLNGNNIIFGDWNSFAGTNTLQVWNAGLRVLSGVPGPSDRGLLLLNITAQDDAGNSLVDQITIHVGNITVAMPIPDQTVFVGSSTMFTVNPGTFEFINTAFTYSAALVGGLPLPAFINFDSESCTFLFTPGPGDQNTYRIQVTAEDSYGGVASTNFNLVIPDRPPVLAQPLANQTAYTGVAFEYIFTNTSFADPDQDKLSYSAQSIGVTWPTWLSFDPTLRRFYGDTMGRGVYHIQVVANDGFNKTVAGSFTLTVPSSAPAVLNPIGTQLASVGNVFIFAVSSNTFISLDGDPMTYFAGPLPSFLSFNNATKTFTGTPQNQDAGTYSITVYAENPFEQSTPTTFALTVLSATNNLPPVVVFQIPDFSVTSGVPFNHTFSSETFEDPEHQTLTYTTMLEGGAPLPNDLYFDGDSLTLSGVVPAPQTLRITMKATDPYGAFALDTFTVTVVDGTNYPPIVLNPLPDELATVGSPFFMQIPANTFKDPGGDPLTITVIQSGGMPLPKWLKWDPKKQIFSGTPGPFDTNTYAIREHTIDVWASDSTGSVKTSFKLSVNGESFWATFIKYGFSFVSVTGTGIALWKGRALIWNYLCKEKYTTPTQTALVGESYHHTLKLKRHEVKEIVFLLNDKPLPQIKPLPEGITYEDDALVGKPTGKDNGRFTVRIVRHDGYIHEQFELIIKNKEEADQQKQLNCTEVTRRRLAALWTSFSPKKTSDEEKGRFGQMNDHLLSSQEMKSLHEGKEEEDQN